MLNFYRIVRTIIRVSGRAFVGRKLNRDEEWIQMNCDASDRVVRFEQYSPADTA